jgi:hypothetical protein
MVSAAERIGYQLGPPGSAFHETLLELAEMVLEPLTLDAAYDFGKTSLPSQLVARGEDIKEYREFWQAPPVDVAYIHRKLAGLFMLASRLKVSVNVHRLIMPWLQ